jgi:hypothetical protein
MSIFHRKQKGGQAVLDGPDTTEHSPRLIFPRGPFASLTTNPPEAADEAYAAFMRHEFTPIVAEREIARIFADCDIACAALERQALFHYALDQETTDLGRLRVIVHWLVQLQHAHESNRAALRMFEKSGNVKRVTILPGCCPVCDRLANRRYRLSAAPDLPVDGCERHGGCICAWAPVVE